MSERITIVVPDGTRDKLKEKAKKQGHTPSSLGRKILTDGLKECDHEFAAKGNGKDPYSALSAECIKCGYRP